MIDIILQLLIGMFAYLPGGYIFPLIGAICGFLYGTYRFIRSFRYLYCYYIEHGVVLCWTDGNKADLMAVTEKYHLNKNFDVFGYVGGIFGIIIYTVLGIVAGSAWPIAAVVGILTIPNFILRHIAREKRSKAIFEQTLKGVEK